MFESIKMAFSRKPSVKMAYKRHQAVLKARINTVAADLGAQYQMVEATIQRLEVAIDSYDEAVAMGLPPVEVEARRQAMTDLRTSLLREEEIMRVRERIVTRRFPEHFQWIK